jgi:general secretion pathway protein L
VTPSTFFEWWLGQLREWIPQRWRRRRREQGDRVIVEITHGGTRIGALVDGESQDFRAFASDGNDAAGQALREFVSSLPRRVEKLEFRVAAGQYVSRELDLPAAAEDNLDDAIGFQLDRLTPFDPQAVVLRSGLVSRDPGARKIRAWFAVTPAQRVEPLLAALRDLRPEPAQPARRPEDAAAPLRLGYRLSARRRPAVGVALALLNIALLVGAASLHWQNREERLAAVERALVEVRRDAAEASELADALERSHAEVLALRERKLAYPIFTAVLDELTRRMPDDTYLQRLEVRDGRVRLFGISAAASNLIGRLEESPLLESVRFESSVTRDAASGRERFSIVADLSRQSPAAPGGT